jgi:hypothetical protein
LCGVIYDFTRAATAVEFLMESIEIEWREEKEEKSLMHFVPQS